MPPSSDSLKFLWDIKKNNKRRSTAKQLLIQWGFFQLFILHFNKNIGEIPFQTLTAVTLR
jgi:hypothetical protein